MTVGEFKKSYERLHETVDQVLDPEIHMVAIHGNFTEMMAILGEAVSTGDRAKVEQVMSELEPMFTSVLRTATQEIEYVAPDVKQRVQAATENVSQARRSLIDEVQTLSGRLGKLEPDDQISLEQTAVNVLDAVDALKTSLKELSQSEREDRYKVAQLEAVVGGQQAGAPAADRSQPLTAFPVAEAEEGVTLRESGQEGETEDASQVVPELEETEPAEQYQPMSTAPAPPAAIEADQLAAAMATGATLAEGAPHTAAGSSVSPMASPPAARPAPRKAQITITKAEPAVVPMPESSKNPLKIAAAELQVEASKWQASGSSMTQIAMNLVQLMNNLADYSKNQMKKEMIECSRAMADGIKDLEQIARDVAKECKDRRLRQQLTDLLDRIPMQSMQLKMISTVKAANPRDLTSDAQMVVCAQNLMRTVKSVVSSCESAAVRAHVAGTFEAAVGPGRHRRISGRPLSTPNARWAAAPPAAGTGVGSAANQEASSAAATSGTPATAASQAAKAEARVRRPPMSTMS